jgi:hypothetical protein
VELGDPVKLAERSPAAPEDLHSFTADQAGPDQ